MDTAGWPRRILEMAVLAGVYFLAGHFGLALASSNKNVTAIWPPTGIAVAGLLLRRLSIWPGITAGAIIANLANGAGLEASLLISVGNTLAPLAAASALDKFFDFRPNLARAKDVISLLVVGGVGAMLISSVLGSIALLMSGQLAAPDYAATWAQWWVGDAMGVILFCPPILTLVSVPWSDSNLRFGLWEALGGGVGFGMACAVVIATKPPLQFIASMVILFVGWASIRFRQQGAALSMLIASSFLTWAAFTNHTQPASTTLTTRVVGLDLFEASIGLVVLILAALEAEREEARMALELATSQLEEAVRRRTKQLEAMTVAAEAASQAKSEYLSRMSHELRTPLTAIIGFAELLAMDKKLSAAADRVQLIIKAADHLEALVDDALDIARIEEGKIELTLEPTDLLATCDEVLDLLSASARENSVTIERDYESRTQCIVSADRNRLFQVVTNVISNAIKYGGDHVVVSVRDAERPGRLRLAVKDTGQGLSQPQLSSLFQPFERLGAERTTIQGTGLGLALSKRLIESMGATIGVQSSPGKGSTFWIELLGTEAPVQRVSRSADAGPAPDANGVTDEKLVLHIEDNADVVDLLERAMSLRTRIKLISTSTGADGLRLAHEKQPDLILLDVHLPDIDGHDVLRALKGDAATRDIPVVVLSADATPPQIESLISLGAASYVTKPIRIGHFLETIDQTLGAHDALEAVKP